MTEPIACSTADEVREVARRVRAWRQSLYYAREPALEPESESTPAPSLESTSDPSLPPAVAPWSKLRMIQMIVATFYSLTLDEMTSNSRKKEVVLPRHVAMFIARRVTNQSLNAIGSRFVNCDHTTVLNALYRIPQRMEHDYELRDEVKFLLQWVTNALEEPA